MPSAWAAPATCLALRSARRVGGRFTPQCATAFDPGTPLADPLPFPVAPQRWAAFVLKRLGWSIDMPAPPGPKMVLLAYPHTSNWDFIIGLIARFTFGWPVRWVGKHTIFRPPFGRFFRWLGGIPINRSRPGGFIDDVVAQIHADAHAIVCIAPEGTRSYVEGWKSGFHRIARTAKVPIALGYIDWGRRCVGIAGYVQPTDDIDADLAAIRAGYASVTAFYPEKAGRIAIR